MKIRIGLIYARCQDVRKKLNLAAFRVPVSEFRNSGESESGGSFFDRINTINKISLFSLYPENPVSEFRNSEAILSKKWNFLGYRIKGGRFIPKASD